MNIFSIVFDSWTNSVFAIINYDYDVISLIGDGSNCCSTDNVRLFTEVPLYAVCSRDLKGHYIVLE